MKNVLIISPYFPPVNAADMQRVRMSLPYFEEFGWTAEVVAVDPSYAVIPLDPLLQETIPPHIKIHYVKALNAAVTGKFGLGSIALRALPFYKRFVDRLLRQKHYDLIYFSTTQFPVCRLGAYWKKKFGVPFVIDMQDPWHTDYYRDKPRALRPKKYWFSYRLNKLLEKATLMMVDGLISVSDSYINTLKTRYPIINDIPTATITFGAFDADLVIARRHAAEFQPFLATATTNIVYVGRGGSDMHVAISALLSGFALGLKENFTAFNNIRLYFIGTSYAPKGEGCPSIVPLVNQFRLEKYVIELTDRIGFFETLVTLDRADALFIPGSDALGYTPSKIYPYLMNLKPLLAIFSAGSPALKVLREYGVPYAFDSDEASPETVASFLSACGSDSSKTPEYDHDTIRRYSAQALTGEQCELFDQVIVRYLELKKNH
jgi:hypothetical protein